MKAVAVGLLTSRLVDVKELTGKVLSSVEITVGTERAWMLYEKTISNGFVDFNRNVLHIYLEDGSSFYTTTGELLLR